MRIGIFFGGQSREREVSFAGGRTIYDNLNKTLFTPIPIFVDSLGNFILLDWQFIYKGTIRDFYPPAQFTESFDKRFSLYIESLSDLSNDQLEKMIASVGKRVYPHEFEELFDFAFLAMHGPYGEDGAVQGLLDWYDIPYSGSGILPSAIGIDKSIQKDWFNSLQWNTPGSISIQRQDWIQSLDQTRFFGQAKQSLGLPFVIKSPRQGSSVGVSILKEDDFDAFRKKVEGSFFIWKLSKSEWNSFSENEKLRWVERLADIREGLGMPIKFEDQKVYLPGEVFNKIESHFQQNEILTFEAVDAPQEVLIESFLKGKEFSCIVIEGEDGPTALPPTEIVKSSDLFDYRAKYLPGISRKVTPIDISEEEIQRIRQECTMLFQQFRCDVYARIDGFFTGEGKIYLNDPNTTSGMLPSSFFFHQAAEIGLNPSQFLTYIIRTSLQSRLKTGKATEKVEGQIEALEQSLEELKQSQNVKTRVGVIMGGFSSERHISVESGRNIFEKLSSSTKYLPIPIFLTGDEKTHELYLLPVNVMLKDNADDIKDKVHTTKEEHPVLKSIRQDASAIVNKYADGALNRPQRTSYEELSTLIDEAFIALHGRPGEDGSIQKQLEAVGIPYNGSGVESSQITINKYDTNEILSRNGIKVAKHQLVWKEAWTANQNQVYEDLEQDFSYPFIAKPADDGCSSAVKKIKDRQELMSFCELLFRTSESLPQEATRRLGILPSEEIPQKEFFLVEDLIQKGDAKYFLEITGGLLTHWEDNQIRYEIFEPSEALASGDILSLEEKFLAGEGQNITPARYAPDTILNEIVSQEVRKELGKVAKILQIEGYARIDAFVSIYEDEHVEVFVIEVNSLPGMTPATCIFHQTAINGYKPYDFIDRILTFGKERLSKTSLIG